MMGKWVKVTSPPLNKKYKNPSQLAKYKNNKIIAPSRSSSDRSSSDDILENVLILQGGGSLGAFGCGVFKSLENNNVKIDIVAGTSIGGVNAADYFWRQGWRASRAIIRTVLAGIG